MWQRQGSWKLLIERVKDAQRRGLLSTPDQEIAYGTYHLLALMKLQDFRAAALEIAAFGDLNAPQYRFENHPQLYPEKSGQLQETLVFECDSRAGIWVVLSLRNSGSVCIGLS
jgi:hypothetical protein